MQSERIFCISNGRGCDCSGDRAVYMYSISSNYTLKDLYITLYGKFTSFLRVKEKTGGMYSVSKANGQKRLYDNFHKDSGQ